MMKRNIFVLFAILACLMCITSGLDSINKRRSIRKRIARQILSNPILADPNPNEQPASYDKESSGSYLLPASSGKVLSKKINNEFVCQEPGLFADVNNNCEVFHMCNAALLPNGDNQLLQYSFFCGNTTIFDQYTLTCQVPEKSVPCEFAPEFFNINGRIQTGKQEVFLHEENDKEEVKKYYDESVRRYNEN